MGKKFTYKTIVWTTCYLSLGILFITLLAPVVRISVVLLSIPLFFALIFYFYYGQPLLQKIWTWITDEKVIRRIAVYAACLYLAFSSYMLLVLPVTQLSEFGVHFVSLAWLEGKPLYHSFNSEDQYSLLYGPLTYLIYAAAYSMVGVNFYAPKVISVVFFSLTIFSIWKLTRNASPSKYRLIIWLIIFSYVGMWATLPFAPKADTLLIAFIGLAMVVIDTKIHFIIKSVLLGILIGLSIHLKVTAILYFIPVVLFLIVKSDRFEQVFSLILVTASAVAFSSLIFITPGLSIEHYMAWVLLSIKHGFSSTIVMQNLLIISPVVFLGFFAKSERPEKLGWLALLIATFLVIFPASKNGAGCYHFAPFLPVLAYLLAKSTFPVERINAMKWGIMSMFALFWLFFVVPVSFAINAGVYTYQLKDLYEMKDRISQFKNKHPHETFAVVGWPIWDPIVYLNGGKLQFSYWSLLDAAVSGKKLSNRSIESLSKCKIKFWFAKTGERSEEHTSELQSR